MTEFYDAIDTLYDYLIVKSNDNISVAISELNRLTDADIKNAIILSSMLKVYRQNNSEILNRLKLKLYQELLLEKVISEDPEINHIVDMIKSLLKN